MSARKFSGRLPAAAGGFRVGAAEERRSRRMAIERFKRFLQDKGLKFTVEREAVLREFYLIHEHIEADELEFRLRRAGVRISRATIYRTLDLLVQAGLARRVRLGRDRSCYEHILGREQHEHMVCIDCGRILEWHDPELRAVLARNIEANRFRATRTSLQVYGYCESCVADGCCADDDE